MSIKKLFSEEYLGHYLTTMLAVLVPMAIALFLWGVGKYLIQQHF